MPEKIMEAMWLLMTATQPILALSNGRNVRFVKQTSTPPNSVNYLKSIKSDDVLNEPRTRISG